MKLKEEQVSAEYMFRGKIINVLTNKARIFDGRIVDREVVEHPGGVGIALEDEEGRFFMVTQYRYAQEKIMLEYPAGKKEKGEDPLTTAKREIVEETGYEGRDFVYLGNMVPTPAYDTEVIELYYAKTGEYKGQHLDDDESIRLSRLTLDEITEKIVSGEINDAKTMGMTFLIKEYKARHSE